MCIKKIYHLFGLGIIQVAFMIEKKNWFNFCSAKKQLQEKIKKRQNIIDVQLAKQNMIQI